MFTVKFSINHIKSFYKAFIVSMMGLFANTIGFDFYHHAISAASLETLAVYNPFWSVYGFIFPRYLFFQYYLWFFSLGILPTALIVTSANAFILHGVYRALIHNRILLLISAAFLSIQIVYFSALGFGISWLFLGFVSHYSRDKEKNHSLRYILIGMSMHPVSFLIGVSGGILFFSRRSKLIVYAVILIILAATLQQLTNIMYPGNAGRAVALENFSILVRKLPELLFISIALLFIKVTFKLKIKHKVFSYELEKQSHQKLRVSMFYSFLMALMIFACYKAYPAHFNTFGPFQALHVWYNAASTKSAMVSIVTGAWISPSFFQDDVLLNQYQYRF